MDIFQSRAPLFSIALIVLLITACARPVVKPPLDSSFTLQLNERLEALPNYTRVYFQAGLRVTHKALDKWTTYCALYVFNREKKEDYRSTVEPGLFNITNVVSRAVSSDDPFNSRSAATLRLDGCRPIG